MHEKNINSVPGQMASLTDGIESDLLNNNLSDLGNAKRFAAFAEKQLRFIPEKEVWYFYNGKYWEYTHISKVRQIAEECIMEILKLAKNDYESNRDLIDFIEKCQSMKHIGAMIAASQSRLTLEITKFDKEHFLFNCANGTLDLTTGEIRPHSRLDFLTQFSPVEFDAKSTPERFLEFLNEVLEDNQNLIAFVQEFFGYALSGDIGEQCLVILRGDLAKNGANGKGTLIETFRKLFSSYSRNANFSTFLKSHSDHIREDRARLVGSRFVTAGEPETNRKIDTSFLKIVTGEDPITAQFKHKSVFEYMPAFKVFLSVNEIPEFDQLEGSILRRIRIIPFNVSFLGEKCDGTLKDKLSKELPGILNWALAGFQRWNKNRLSDPKEINEAMEQYLSGLKEKKKAKPDPNAFELREIEKREKQKAIVQQFIDDKCVVRGDLECPFGMIWHDWEYYCQDRGHEKYSRRKRVDAPTLSKTQLAELLEEMGFKGFIKEFTSEEKDYKGEKRKKTHRMRYRRGLKPIANLSDEEKKGEDIVEVKDGSPGYDF